VGVTCAANVRCARDSQKHSPLLAISIIRMASGGFQIRGNNDADF